MEGRKIIRFGNSSHVVSVPKSWIQENKLKKGDLVYFEQNSNGELVLWPKEREDVKEKKITIDVNGKSVRDMEREIIAAYIKGFNILSIETSDLRKSSVTIKRILKNLVGIEILEKSSKEIVAADFLDIKNVSLKGVIKRMDTNIRSMFDDINSCLSEGSVCQEHFDEIYETDTDVNKFYFLLWKITVMGLNNPSLLHKLKTDAVELVHTWWLAMSIERIGDELKRIARGLKDTKIKNGSIKRFREIFNTVKKTYIDATNAYYKNDTEAAYGITAKRRDIMGECETLSSKDRGTVNINEKVKTIQTQIHNIAKCTIYFT